MKPIIDPYTIDSHLQSYSDRQPFGFLHFCLNKEGFEMIQSGNTRGAGAVPENPCRQEQQPGIRLKHYEHFDLVDIDLKGEWNGLLAQSDGSSIFLTYEWLRSWWHAYGNDNKLCTVSARDPEGKLIGIAPLYRHRSRYYKIPAAEVTFIGDKASDRQTFIVHRDHPEVYGMLLSEITSGIAYDIVRLEQVPAESPLIAAIKNLPNCETEIDTTLPYVEIGSGWEDFRKSLSSKFKRDLKHKYNVLKKAGPWSVACITDAETISNHLDHLAAIETESRKGQRDYALFADRRALALHRKFLALSRPHQWAALFLLTSNDIVISYLLAFNFNNTLCAYNMGYLPDFYRMSPGKLVLNEAVRYAFDNRLTEFDFLRGNSYIKTLWCQKARRNHRIVVFRPSLKASMLRYLVFQARPFLKHYCEYALKMIARAKPSQPSNTLKNDSGNKRHP